MIGLLQNLRFFSQIFSNLGNSGKGWKDPQPDNTFATEKNYFLKKEGYFAEVL
jgi:hypothetical protein